jgi:hypothetical protein
MSIEMLYRYFFQLEHVRCITAEKPEELKNLAK